MDIQEECQKFGTVVFVGVDFENEVYLRCVMALSLMYLAHSIRAMSLSNSTLFLTLAKRSLP